METLNKIKRIGMTHKWENTQFRGVESSSKQICIVCGLLKDNCFIPARYYRGDEELMIAGNCSTLDIEQLCDELEIASKQDLYNPSLQNKIIVMENITPIFDMGKIQQLPHCYIQNRELRNGTWMYFIYNSYNCYASGWADEDFIISEINKKLCIEN